MTASSPAGGVLPRTDWVAVALGVTLGVAAALFIGKLPPALPLLQRELGLSLAEAGWAISMFNLLALGTALFFGLLADRVGPYAMALAGMLGLSAGGFLGALADDAGLLLASRVLEGAGFIAVAVSAPSLIGAACTTADLRKALGLWAIYMPLGGSLAMLAAPAILAWIDWRALWWMVALVSLALAAALGVARRRYRLRASGKRRFADLILVLRQPAPWQLAAAFALYAVQFFTIIMWLPTFLVGQRGIGVGQASLLTALVVFVNVPGNLAAIWLMRFGARRGSLVIAAHALMGLCALVIFADALPDAVRYAGCLGLTLFGGMLPTAALSSAQVLSRDPARIGGIQGLMLQGSNLGQFVAPPMIAAVVGAAGWPALMPLLAGCALAGAACGAWVRRAGI